MPLAPSPIATSFFKSLIHPHLLHHQPTIFVRRNTTTREIRGFRHQQTPATRTPTTARFQPRLSWGPCRVGVSSGGTNGYDRPRHQQQVVLRRATLGTSISESRQSPGGGEKGKNVQVSNGAAGDGKQPVASTGLLTLPTVLTIGRVAAVPLLVSTFYMNTWWSAPATTSVFLAAAITDWLDGYIARKMHLGTAFGAFLDPVADKLMVAATLVLLCTRPLETSMFGQAPWIMTVPSIAIIGREITMSAVREWAASQDSKVLEAVAVNKLGKWKTATQMIALTILLATREATLKGTDSLVASGVVLLYISAGLAVWSLVVYTRKIWKILRK